MRRSFLAFLGIILAAALMAVNPDPAARLRKANDLFKEQSWQMALDEYDALIADGGAGPDVKREARVMSARALISLNRHSEAVPRLESAVVEPPEDIWTGRASWYLALARLRHYTGEDQRTSMIADLKRAEEILVRLKAPDLADFYRDLTTQIVNSVTFDKKEQRAYVFGFFDKLAPILTSDEEIAGNLLRKADRNNYVTQEADDKGWLASHRAIHNEFPRTVAARQALLKVGNFLQNQNDLVAAVDEYEKVVKEYAGTDEAKSAREMLDRIRQEEIAFVVGEAVRPGKPVEINITARNVGGAELEAIPFDPMSWLRNDKRTNFILGDITGSAHLTKSVALKPRSDFKSTTAALEITIDKPGAYVLCGKAGAARCNALLLVSDLALVSNTSSEGVEFWTVDATTGKPRADVGILVASKPEGKRRLMGLREVSEFTRFHDLKSDRDGFAVHTPTQDASGQIVAVAKDGDSFAILDTHANYRNRDGRQLQAYVYTDRSVYRPSQKVYWRAILREREDGAYSTAAGTQYEVRISDSRGQEVWKKDMAASEFGTLNGELELTENPPLGQYSIQLMDKRGNGRYGHGTFRVEEYKKPEYEVAVSTGEGAYRLGSEVSASVKATYYFGAPVAHAEVKYTVRRRIRHIWAWPDWAGGPAAKLEWFDATDPRDPVMHGSHGDIIASGEGKTDASGNYKVEFKAEKPLNEPEQPHYYFSRGWWGWQPPIRAYDFQVEATVIDASRRNIDGSRTVTVSDKALNLRVSTPRRLYAPKDIITAEMSSANLSGDPRPSSGTLYVERLEWQPDLKEEKVTTITTQKAEVGTSGVGTVQWRSQDAEPGRYRLLYEAADPYGGKSYGAAVVVVADEKTKDIAVKYQGIEVTTDKETYEVGETARLLVTNEFAGATAWLWVDSGSGNIEKKVVPLESRTNFIALPLTDAYVPNVKVNMVVVREGSVYQASQELIVPPLKRVLTVDLAFDEETYKPRQEGTIKLRIRDHAGRPVKGEFSLAVYDKSVLYIAPDQRTDIRRQFYGERRPIWSNILQSGITPGRYQQTVPEHLWFFGGRFEGQVVATRSFRGTEFRRGGIGGEMLAADMAAAPAAAAPMAAGRAMAMESAAFGQVMIGDKAVEMKMSASTGTPDFEAAELRTDFRDSIFWSASIVTDENGEAVTSLKFPDSLTTWRADTVGIAREDTLVGEAKAEVIVKKNLLVRLETPRFFRERDTVTISAIVHNYLSSEKSAAVTLTVDGLTLDTAPEQRVTVPAGGETRVDWTISVKQWGEATLRVEALTDEESDAVELKKPVLPHGIDKFVAWNGSADMNSTAGVSIEGRDDGGTTVTTIVQTVDIPKERIVSSTRLTVQLTPSLAVGIRDALPYMIDYPYGCVEQTMSRFLPAAVAAKTFDDLGIPRDELLKKKLPDVLQAGLARLASMQRGSGGWGWWQNDNENPYITAYVMHGLSVARSTGVEIDDAMFQRGLDSVRRSVADAKPKDEASIYWRNNDLHTLALQSLVLALNNEKNERAVDMLYEKRADLSAHGMAMLVRVLKRAGRNEQAEIALRNLHNFAVPVPENNTIHWGRRDRCWYWWDDAVEATAQGLLAHLEFAPDHPMTTQAMKWLVLNREGNRWKSTKDTALAVLALTAAMKQRGETAASFEVEVAVGDRKPRKLSVTPDNFWKFDGRIVLEGDAAPDGSFPVTITHRGKGALYYSIFAEYFTLEEGIKKAGNEIFVERTYEKLSRKAMATTDVVAQDEYTPIRDGDKLVSGDEIRVTLRLRSLNDYEYLVFEDAKPAGCEAVALQSGSVYAGFCSNMELRDELVAFFVTHLPQGEHTITYNLRAEIPGTFHAMPTKGYAMYFPILRANSDEMVLTVVDRPAKP